MSKIAVRKTKMTRRKKKPSSHRNDPLRKKKKMTALREAIMQEEADVAAEEALVVVEEIEVDHWSRGRQAAHPKRISPRKSARSRPNLVPFISF